jgi:hypothetical protein
MTMKRLRSKDGDKFKRIPIKQHRDLLTDPQYQQRVGATKRSLLNRQEELEHKQELQDFLHGKDQIQE